VTLFTRSAHHRYRRRQTLLGGIAGVDRTPANRCLIGRHCEVSAIFAKPAKLEIWVKQLASLVKLIPTEAVAFYKDREGRLTLSASVSANELLCGQERRLNRGVFRSWAVTGSWLVNT
jgi:hypothetical protein